MAKHRIAPAGTYELISFKIIDLFDESRFIELNKIVASWDLIESIKSGSLKGSAKIFDSKGMFYNFPLRGQEIVEITYSDFKYEEKTHKFMVYSITDVKSAKMETDNNLEFVLNFVSFGKWWSERFSVTRCFAEGTEGNRTYLPIHEQVKTLFDEYYYDEGRGTLKEIEIHETEGEQKIIIPNMTPEEAMHLFSRKAYTANEFYSQNYRFFENRDKYWFANIEEMMFFGEADQLFIYSSSPKDDSPEGELKKMQNILNLNFLETTNTLDIIRNGGYNRRVREVDIMNRQILDNEYEHLEEWKQFEYPDLGAKKKLPHSDEMIREHFNKFHDTYVIKDYPSPDEPNASGLRPKTYYSDIYAHKGATLFHYNQSKIEIQIYGTNEVVAGDVIQLELPQFKVKGEIDVERSGFYLVESIVNDFYENTYTQVLTLSKGVQLDEYKGA